jgi:hypothetical protein
VAPPGLLNLAFIVFSGERENRGIDLRRRQVGSLPRFILFASNPALSMTTIILAAKGLLFLAAPARVTARLCG